MASAKRVLRTDDEIVGFLDDLDSDFEDVSSSVMMKIISIYYSRNIVYLSEMFFMVVVFLAKIAIPLR